jgi:5-methyltetrahydropteroyltriglutamate--homocysteine methyltransferase
MLRRETYFTPMPSFRADHVGSFLRPQHLLDARASAAPEELRAVEDVCILDALSKQKEAGLSIFTDGEFRRRNFMSDFVDAVDGVDTGRDAGGYHWQHAPSVQEKASAVAGIATDKIIAKRRMTGHEVPFLLAKSPGPAKITLPSATQFPMLLFQPGITDQVYADRSELLADIASIVSEEVATLAKEGVSYIQIDAPRYSWYIDPKWREKLRAETGMDPEEALDEAIAADNKAFDAARAAAPENGPVLAIHLCRGNNRGNWYAEGGYDAIAEKLFSGLNVDRFLLEYDDERSGSFEPLRFVPKGRTVVLGLVSTKRAELEKPVDVLRRIDEAARLVPLENLAVSPQCGFASVAEGNPVTEDVEWAKIRLVADVARQVWG